MNKLDLEKIVSDGKSISEISSHFGKSPTTIRYWLRKTGLKTAWSGFLNQKYSDEELLNFANNSLSFTECLQKMCANLSGGAFYYYKERLTKLDLIFLYLLIVQEEK